MISTEPDIESFKTGVLNQLVEQLRVFQLEMLELIMAR